jgi:alkanesulfonate monooxygenase SsuD/methylene tetrahydromethanopterin reductase-like flavin-dependent oxidoreductase (luciferase family)
MEFGMLVQGHVPGPDAHDPEKEHAAFLHEAALVQHADRNGWKYVWTAEHHTLTEYSHLAASDVWMGYLAHATSRIHLGAGIFNLSPRVNHPIRNAERAALLDHLSEGRFEFGTGRGAGSHELSAFMVKDTESTRSEWDEVVWEIPRMWERKDYTFHGRHFTVDIPHNVLPKPHGPGHPAIWLACGNPATFAKAGAHGIGALGFTFAPVHDMKPHIDAYKQGIVDCTDPVGQFVNDNAMIANGVICMATRERAREIALRPDRNYIITLVNLYHDTFPKPPGAPVWPEAAPEVTPELLDQLISAGVVLCGSPEDVCEQLEAYQSVGLDQIAFAVPGGAMTPDENFECVELVGRRVVPEFDRDPVHSTTRFRAAAVPKYGPFAPVG